MGLHLNSNTTNRIFLPSFEGAGGKYGVASWVFINTSEVRQVRVYLLVGGLFEAGLSMTAAMRQAVARPYNQRPTPDL